MRPTKWWQPASPEKVLFGVLDKDQDDEWHLELDGNFAEAEVTDGVVYRFPSSLPDVFPVIVGESEGKLVSLIKCRPRSSVPAFAGLGGSLNLSPTTIVGSVHFESHEDFCLTSLSGRYKHLNAWVATSGFTIDFNTDFARSSIHYSKPEAVVATLNRNLELAVDFSSSGPNMKPAVTRMEMAQDSWLTIRSKLPMHYDELISHLHGFSNLIALFIGRPLIPIEFEGSCIARIGPNEEETAEQGVSIISNRKPISRDSGTEVPFWEVLFTLPMLRPRFGGLMRAWFSRASNLQSLYDLYFGGLHGPARYVEHRFVNIFQALESYHRRGFAPEPAKRAEREERFKRILDSVTGKDKKWLKDKLQQIPEMSAEERIRRLVVEAGADWLLTTEQIALSAKLRNYYTPFDPHKEADLPATNVRYRIMLNLTTRLRVLCELIMLHAVGLGRDEVRERMQETRRVERHLVSEDV